MSNDKERYVPYFPFFNNFDLATNSKADSFAMSRNLKSQNEIAIQAVDMNNML